MELSKGMSRPEYWSEELFFMLVLFDLTEKLDHKEKLTQPFCKAAQKGPGLWSMECQSFADHNDLH